MAFDSTVRRGPDWEDAINHNRGAVGTPSLISLDSAIAYIFTAFEKACGKKTLNGTRKSEFGETLCIKPVSVTFDGHELDDSFE